MGKDIQHYKYEDLEKLNKQQEFIITNLNSINALEYLDDIAHGRKMRLDAHKLKLIVEQELIALQIVKEIAEFYNIEFCDKDQSIFFKLPYRNKFILERISFKDKKKYELLKEVLKS